jgi:hypothetical protein
VRKSYVRKDGTRVKSARVTQGCIKDIGRRGRGKVLIQSKYKLRKGALTALGYHVNDTAEKRRAALVAAVKSGVPINSLIWKLNAQFTFRRNAQQGTKAYVLGQRFRSDQQFLSALRKKGGVRRRSPKGQRRGRKARKALAPAA